MRKLLIILLLLSQATFAQVDSLTHPSDTLVNSVNHKLDSIEGSFANQVDSLKQSYGQTKNRIEAQKSKYQTKIDSLNNLKLPSEKYTHKMDSMNNELASVQEKATAKIDSLKSQVTAKVKSLNLPPEAEERISKLSSSVDKINLPGIDADIENKIGLGKLNEAVPGLTAPGINTNVLPSENLPTTDATLPSVTMPGNDIQAKLDEVAGKAEGIQQLREGMSAEKFGETVERKASQLDQVKAIQDQTSLPESVPATGDEAKEQLKNMAKKEAINHFAGKEARLQQAMDKMSKYKAKYNSVSSVKDLPLKRANPLKEKPFVERIIPAITMQFQSFKNFMVDVNASAGFRFTEHITAGIGWNQRWAYAINDKEFNSSARIYGVRSYSEYQFKKGFGLRADVEYMNTEVSIGTPPNEITYREWVWSVFSGLKQEYSIAGRLKGNIQVLYNLFDPHHKSPYVDRLNIRMGFEFVLKKNKKEKASTK